MEIITEWILEQTRESRPPNNFINTDILRDRLGIPKDSANNDWQYLCYRIYQLYKEGYIDFSDGTKQILAAYSTPDRGALFLYTNVIIGAQLLLTMKGEELLLSYSKRKVPMSKPRTKRRHLSTVEKNDILARQKHRCAMCDTEFTVGINPQYDHIVALSKDGKDELDNIHALCPNCHDDKTRRERLSEEKLARKKPTLTNKGILKLKTFARTVNGGFAEHNWVDTFMPGKGKETERLTQNKVIEKFFSDPDPNNIKDYLQVVVGLYPTALKGDREAIVQFREVCKEFGFDFKDGRVI